MKNLYALILLCFIGSVAYAQDLITHYPKTIKVTSDTIRYRWNYLPKVYSSVLNDTINTGTDGSIGIVGTVYYGKDSVVVPYKNLPNRQITYFNIEKPNGEKVVFMFRFNGVASAFTSEYIAKNTGNIQVEIPEVYELANIIWTLSPSGQRATDLNKEGAYYTKMMAHFKPYLNHPIFKQLDFADSVFYDNYYDFRENSFKYQFDKNKLTNKGPYYYVWGDDEKVDLFTRLLPLVQEFAQKSKFRDFYKANQDFYAGKIKREAELMPIKNMWTWLETNFPKNKYQSYKVVFSPLIGGSHSTQNFSTYNQKGTFAETVMFICGTDRYEKPTWTEKQKEGLMSGIVFTEIDHNYVNPVSRTFRKAIDSVYRSRAYWANEVKGYNSSESVFNEYMTHAVFCLWVMDNYDKQTADVVIGARVDMMVNRRKFSKFKEFNDALTALHLKNKRVPVANLYPGILAWSKAQK